ncbi:putative VCX1-vacuolar Ca++/H+ exchanger [Serendipita vermifera]|nr:putative VCX1-vacuolar Ca++/H+ exchanger [Serendipita vermifera]
MSERDPLIAGGSNGNHSHRRGGSLAKLHSVLAAQGQPSYAASFKWFLFDSWWNVLLVFIPLSFLAHHLNWDAALRFSFSFFAIMPLARLLGEATDQLSLELGQTLGALLNASFGNAVEIIVGIAALLQGELRIVQTSMLGSILSNILLVLGCAFFAGGLSHHEGSFQETGAQAASSLMTLSCITLIIPAAYHASFAHPPEGHAPDPDDGTKGGLLLISRGTSILLLVLYVAYLNFQLRTHPDLFRPRASSGDEEEEHEEQKMNLPASCLALLGVTVVTSFCADYLVASIEETAERYSIPEAFIGLILIPIVANAAEHFTAVWMAMKDKMEVTIGIAVGSSIQISTLVIPLLVIVGWITGHNLTLFFANFETISLFVAILLVNMMIQDGKSNYMEGLMLIGLYIVIALAFWAS